jgi:nitrate/nitrite transport system permease protein
MAVSISRRSKSPKWVKDLQKKLTKLATSAIALLIFLLLWQILCFSPDAPFLVPLKLLMRPGN